MSPCQPSGHAGPEYPSPAVLRPLNASRYAPVAVSLHPPFPPCASQLGLASLLPVYPQKREKRTVDSAAGASASAVAQGVAASTRSVMVSQKPMATEVGEDNTVVNW